MHPRLLIASDFNAGDRAHFALSYEFCRVVAECDHAELVAPPLDNYLARHLGRILPPDTHNIQRDFNRLVNGARKTLRLRHMPTITATSLTANYDLFFFVGWGLQSLVELQRLGNWRSRTKIAVAYLFELWSSTIERDHRYLKLLAQFDHVFLLHSASVPVLKRHTGTPCHFLPTGVDCLIATPYPSCPDRVIDAYSLGRRNAAIHQQLVSLVQQRGLFYVYDSLSSSDSRVKDWQEHRLLLVNMIKRSRYFMCYSPSSLTTDKSEKAVGEQVLPARLFEGAAGGAVMLGTAPQCPEFWKHFDWPDAVIELSLDACDIAGVIDDLEAQPQRLERARRTNATQSLLRHDWVYRWEQILATVGVDALPQLYNRKARLAEIAASAAATFDAAALRKAS